MYRIEADDRGEIEPLISDWLLGKQNLGEIIQRVASTRRPQSQRVASHQVGAVEDELPGVVSSPSARTEASTQEAPRAAPSIFREDIDTKKKVLTVSNDNQQLNNFRLFLGLSDRLFQRQRDFFRFPHATRVLWGGHRVTYIFNDDDEKVALYYDIELKNALDLSL